jgi:hypothetical protein
MGLDAINRAVRRSAGPLEAVSSRHHPDRRRGARHRDALRFGRGAERRPRARGAGAPVGRSAEDWRSDAALHEAAGRWRDALRCRYRALVAELAGNGLLDDLPGKTTGEERADISIAAPAASPSFSEATELFDDVWYGDAPTGPDDAARFRSLSDRVLAEAER